MCFICSESEGFDTDISKIIRLNRNSNFGIISEKVAPIPNQKIYLSITSEPNKTLNPTKLTITSDFSDFKVEKKGKGDYQIKTDSDDIAGNIVLTASEEAVSRSKSDINTMIDRKGTYDPVTGLNIDAAKMFRLYSAAFQRLPEADDINDWLQKYRFGQKEVRDIAAEFLDSFELTNTYGIDISNENYVRNLYQNVLQRTPDISGMNYWLGQLVNGTETRSEVFLGFAESEENKALFSSIMGFE